MKIGIWGMTPKRGRPLAALLGGYGRHSVVGWPQPPRDPHPDPDVREFELQRPTPMAPNVNAFMREAADLVIVDSDHINGALSAISYGVRGPLPVVIVTPGVQVRLRHQELLVGLAPFDYAPHRALARLLHLRQIQVRHALEGQPWGKLTDTITSMWAWVDNKIPVYED